MDDMKRHESPQSETHTAVNACIVLYEKAQKNILLSMRYYRPTVLWTRQDELLRQKDVLLDEIEHRVANSLQIIASIIMLKAKSVESEETRRPFAWSHNRVISVAACSDIFTLSAVLVDVMLPICPRFVARFTHSMIDDGQSIR